MACKKCGGVRGMVARNYPVYHVTSSEEELVGIGAKSSFMIEGLALDQVFLGVGKTTKVGKTAAADLITQGAPIWIIS